MIFSDHSRHFLSVFPALIVHKCFILSVKGAIILNYFKPLKLIGSENFPLECPN